MVAPANSGYCRGILRGAHQYAAARGGWHVTRRDLIPPGSERELDRCDGVIYCQAGRGLPVAAVLRPGLAVVDVSNAQDTPGVAQVTSDDILAGRMAAEHLLACGHRHFAWAGYNQPAYGGKRRQGFISRLSEQGISVHERSLYQGRQVAGRWIDQVAATTAWLRELPRPCGLLAASDVDAAHVASLAVSAGVAIPDDIAIMGVDDDDLACMLTVPSLSTIALDGERVGRLAATLLDRLLSGERVAGQTLIPPLGVRARGSTSAEPIADPVLRAAVGWLRRNSHTDLRMADCACAAGVAERTLRARCLRLLGRPPQRILQELRIAHAERLLAGSDLPLKAVAVRCGFASAAYLCTAFRAVRGTSPAAWRRKTATA
jgi:LacI family transcriptional regulator